MTFLQLFIATLIYSHVINATKDDSTSSSNKEQEIMRVVNRDIVLNAAALIESRGYISKEYDVQTNDGYILTIQRIINPLLEEQDRENLKPVILMHSIFGSASDWLVNSEGVEPKLFGASDDIYDMVSNSLAFSLSNNRYDVWLGTMRGSAYGQRHIHLTFTNSKFWDFSQDEHIKYDLPAIIEFIQETTKQQTIGYVGFSHGSLMAFGLLSERPEFSNIIKPFISLAPLAYSPLTHHVFKKEFIKLFKFLTPVNGGALRNEEAFNYMKLYICDHKIDNMDICDNLLYMLFGFNAKRLDKQYQYHYIHRIPPGTSIKTLVHYGQMAKYGRLAHFHYGKDKNKEVYGTSESPSYDLGKIQSPDIFMYFSRNDLFSGLIGVDITRSSILPQIHVYEIAAANWGHYDYLYSRNCGEVINTKVLNTLVSSSD